MTKKIFAMFLAVLMVVSVLPISAMAASDCPGKGTAHTIENCEYTQVSVVAPTCGAPGYTYYECNKCHDKFVGSPVAATGEHTFEPTEAKAPTCEKPGNAAGLKCKDCGKLDAPVIEPLYKDKKCEWTEWAPKNIDCTVGGVQTRTCNVCGGVETTDPVEAKNAHKFGTPELKTPATATSNGVAVQKCENALCGEKREIVVYYSHDCVIEEYKEVPADCATGTNGSKKYYACRICGVKYTDATGATKLSPAEIQALVIKADHNFVAGTASNGKTYAMPSCSNSTAYCSLCEKEVKVQVKHNYVADFVALVPQGAVAPDAPTCTVGGYNLYTCKSDAKNPYAGCGHAYTGDVPALGHKTITVSVPATCKSFAYTYTYCVREDCDSPFVPTSINNGQGLTFKVADLVEVDSLSIVAPSYATSAFMGVASGLGYDLYFNGVVADGKLNTTFNGAEAVKVNIAMVHPSVANAYYLYITNAEGGKSYIEAYKNDAGEVALRLTTTAPSTYFALSGKQLQVQFRGDSNTYVFAAGKTVDTIGLVKSNATDVNFTILAQTNAKKDAKLTACTVDVVGGYNDNGHVWDLGSVTTAHTHETEGVKTFTCSCGATKTEKIAAGHTWVAFASVTEIKIDGKMIPSSKNPDCTEGWVYKYCSECAADGEDTYKKDKTYAGYGHKMGDLIVETPSHIAPTVYDHKDCEYCTYTEKVGEAKVWADSNKHYASRAEALVAHPGLSASGSAVRSATCTVYGLESYTCNDCSRVVLVQIPNLHTPSSANTTYSAPTCDDKGAYVTFKCATCDTVIGKGVVGQTSNEIAKLGHVIVKNELPEGLKCESYAKDSTVNPVYEHCVRCSYSANVFKASDLSNSLVTDCTQSSMSAYECKLCGGLHAYNFPGKLNHDMINDGAPTDSTCTEAGVQNVKCRFCAETDVEILPLAPHKNLNGDEFYTGCQDTQTDRHCVVCCEHTHDCTKQKNKDGSYKCDCMISNGHDYVTAPVASTCLETAYEMGVCKYCSAPQVSFSKLPWSGHQPVAVGADGKHANYVYEDFKWYKIVVADDTDADGNPIKVLKSEFVTITDAEFIEYVPATYAADGYWKGECAICKQVVTQALPKLTGLGFEMIVSNANGAKDYSYGSLVEVVLSVTGSKTDLHGFTARLPIDDELVYVGYEVLNKDFNITVTEPAKVEKADPTVAVIGAAKNTLAGKQQNINIDGEVQLVKLLFRVVENEKGEAKFDLVVPNAVYLKDGETKDISGARIDSDKIKVRGFLDFDHSSENVGSTETSGNINDLFLAMSLLTGEHPEGKTYDVTVDINKDGVITLEDLSIAYNYAVGNYTDKEIAQMGLSDAEIAILFPAVNVCLRPTCPEEVPVGAQYCPVCGFNQY